MTLRMRPSTSGRGFTLVELLVVIAILAVLIGLMLPILSSIQRGARATECVSNLRQLGMAAINYSAENDGALLPSGQEDQSPPKNSYTWVMLLQKYLIGPEYTTMTRTPFNKASYCPSFYSSDPRGPRVKPADQYKWTWTTGYIINDVPDFPVTTATNRIRLNNKGERTDLNWTADFRMDRLTYKSVRPWLMDGSEWQTGSGGAPSVATSKYGGIDYSRHGHDRSNVLFFDAHVEASVSESDIRKGIKSPADLSPTGAL